MGRGEDQEGDTGDSGGRILTQNTRRGKISHMQEKKKVTHATLKLKLVKITLIKFHTVVPSLGVQ